MDEEDYKRTREFFREQLREGIMEDKDIEIEHKRNIRPTMKMFTSAGVEEMDFALQDLFNNIVNPSDKKKSKMKVKEARKIIKAEEEQKVVNMDKIITDARERVEERGIVFIDEIDKIVGSGSQHGPDVSRGGVQRDLLPIVEGTNVMTKYGIVKTHHILFIAAGAFQGVKPTDLIPELQVRFPIRVELKSLDTEDFKQILTKPKNALIKQYSAMLHVDGINVDFEKSGIERIAYYASKLNSTTENIGARRLQTVLSYILDEIMFEVPGEKGKNIKIDGSYVDSKVEELVESDDLKKYII
jgi:ATP-dependent HslUV protease ATP-binding subunit HslU